MSTSEEATACAAGEGETTELIAEHYDALAGDVRKDCDAHWSIAERWSYGERVGWFVEHDGYCYDGLEYGEDGPHSTREAAERCMVEHLHTAIAEARERSGGRWLHRALPAQGRRSQLRSILPLRLAAQGRCAPFPSLRSVRRRPVSGPSRFASEVRRGERSPR